MERFNPLNDYLFLKIMGEEGDEEQCLAFLNAVLADSNESSRRLVKILGNRSLSPETLGDKGIVLDFIALAETENRKNIRVNVEVQLKDLHNMTERTLYYWSREYISGIKEGEDYGGLPRVIAVNIVNFDHIKLEEFHTVFRLREDAHREYVLTDLLEIHFLNMIKFRKLERKDMNKPLERWLTFFDERTPEQTLREVIGMDAAIQKAQSRLEEVTQDYEVRRTYIMRQKALSDWTTGVNTAFEKGIEKGRVEGSLDIAKKALAEGATIDFIQKITGLSLEDIVSLQTK
jgi:predicted transposase/invertase (TIGR01784 family)